MSQNLPILISVITAVIGAGWLALSFRQMQRPLWVGAIIGAGAGAASPLILMLPLNYCAFEAERTPADTILGVLLIGLSLAIVLLPLNWLLRLRLNPTPVRPTPGGFRAHPLVPWLLLLPTLTILILFLYYPSLDTLRLSTLLARLGAARTAFVCLDNFTSLAYDPTYLNSVVITLVISVAIVVIGLSLSLLIATMAYQPVRGARIYRTLLIWPYAISPVVAGIIFLLLFNPVGGIINYFLTSLFGFRINWLTEPTPAIWAVILSSVWKSMGYNILFYIAGLQNIPSDLKEASSIDGANSFQRFFFVVVPLLRPITFFLIITNMTYAFFETFGTIDYLTGGGPLEATTTMMYRVYEVGIQNRDLGRGAAQSLILFALVIGLTVLQFRTERNRSAWGS
jgi:sn-glycerol 3-phosphate transport system permease protein